jgi:hypothetical protein
MTTLTKGSMLVGARSKPLNPFAWCCGAVVIVKLPSLENELLDLL